MKKHGEAKAIKKKGMPKLSGRKEIAIFGVVIVAIIAVFVVSKVLDSEKHYNGDNVTLNFGQSTSQGWEGDSLQDDLVVGDFEGQSEDEAFVPPEDALVADVSGDIPGEAVSGNSAVHEWYVSDVGKVRDESESTKIERPSSDEYVTMMMHYVCGIDDDKYSMWVTSGMRKEFNSHLDAEPYKSLSGNTVYENVQFDDTSFSFTDGSGTRHTFSVEFFGDAVSSVKVVQ